MQQALERDRTLFEHRGQVVPIEPVIVTGRPMTSLGLYLADMGLAVQSSWTRHREWLAANDGFRQRHPDARAPVGSWRDRRRSTAGRRRVWDLAERVYPPEVQVIAADEARGTRDERWSRALGVARPQVVGDAGLPVEIQWC